MQIGVNLVVNLDHDLLPVFLAPIALLVHVSHDLSLLVGCVNLLDIHIVHLHQILLEFRLAQEVVDSKVDPLFTVIFGSAHEFDFVADKVNLGLRLTEVTCDRLLETFRVHVVLVLLLLFVVFVKLLQRLRAGGLGDLKFAQIGVLQVANLS